MLSNLIKPLSDEEESRIQAGIARDDDSPQLTDEQLAHLRPFSEVCPDLMTSIKRSRGRPKAISPREAVTLRLSPDTIARFKLVAGKDWRARMTNVLEHSQDD